MLLSFFTCFLSTKIFCNVLLILNTLALQCFLRKMPFSYITTVQLPNSGDLTLILLSTVHIPIWLIVLMPFRGQAPGLRNSVIWGHIPLMTLGQLEVLYRVHRRFFYPFSAVAVNTLGWQSERVGEDRTADQAPSRLWSKLSVVSESTEWVRWVYLLSNTKSYFLPSWRMTCICTLKTD